MSFSKLFTKQGLLNVLCVAGPIVAGVVSGGVFTAPVIITAISALAGKLAHSLEQDHAELKQARADKRGQVADQEEPQ